MVANNGFIRNLNQVSTINNANAYKSDNKKVGQKQIPAHSFSSVLNSEIEKGSGLKFSKHAELRMVSRNISLSQEQKERLSKAVDKAEKKGVNDSLVLADNMAFVVNVKNRTVVTVVNNADLQDNVFTNIDGAVFA